MQNMMIKTLTGVQRAVQAVFLAVVFVVLAGASSTLLALQVIRGF